VNNPAEPDQSPSPEEKEVVRDPSPAAHEPSAEAALSAAYEPNTLLVAPTRNAQHDFSTTAASLARHRLYPMAHWFIYLAMAYVVFQVEGWLLTSLRSNVGVLVWRMLIEAMMMLAAILPGFAMAKIEGHQFGDFGLPMRHAFGRNFWVGSLWGVGSLSVLMVSLRLSGAYEFGGVALHGPRIAKFAIYYGVLFLGTAFFEEFLMRGYSQWVLSRALNFWPAAVFLSALFGYMHKGNPGEARTGLVAAGLIGLFFCLTLRRTGDLWWAVGFHMAWDWGESFLYSVPDSGAVLPGHLLNSSIHGRDWLTGGSVGPEGSYLVFVLIGALWIVFDRLYPDAKYGNTEMTQSLATPATPQP
jgi:hypothetical protein